MKKMLFAFAIGLAGLVSVSLAQSVSIQHAPASPRQAYATSVLGQAASKKGHPIKKTGGEYLIRFVIDTLLGSEAYAIKIAGKQINITGGDETGLLYGSLTIAEDLRNGIALQKIEAKSEKPKLPFRAIKYDMPWDTYRHSLALDLHSETCKDVAYWKAFLDMMAENRLNVLSLWNLHPYVYMIKPKNFQKQVPGTIKK
jgi:N-acetyl-beta-hexosaminidase